MSTDSFVARSVPSERIEHLNVIGGCSSIFAAEQPQCPVVGDWEQRHCTLFDSFKPILNRVHEFEVRQDDVWIVTNPKCGTTWTQEMTWLLLNNFDYQTAKDLDLSIRSPFLEFNGLAPNTPDVIAAANQLPSPRLIKSHLPAWLLPKDLWKKQPKIIYVFRDPKDAALSFFHHYRGMDGYNGTKEDYMRSYIDGHIMWNPFWPHVLDFWQMRHRDNVFFTSYERMKRDLSSVIRDVCQFLGKEITDEQLALLKDHLSFDKMRKNPSCNHQKEFEMVKANTGHQGYEFTFVRRGIVGSHKDELSISVIQEFDDWTRDNLKSFNLSVEDFVNFSKY